MQTRLQSFRVRFAQKVKEVCWCFALPTALACPPGPGSIWYSREPVGRSAGWLRAPTGVTDLMTNLIPSDGTVIINPRSPSSYGQGWIPGAGTLPEISDFR